MPTASADARLLAKTILDQIGSGFGQTLMCIGAHGYLCVPETINTDPINGHLGGVFFKINPNPKMKVHGRVQVTLDASDTYTVKITTCRGKVLLEQKGVYCDELSKVIEGVTG